jgi:MOSC domain-containing protein YiiM
MTDPAARVLAIHLCKGARVPMESPAAASARAGFGLEGDRHARTGSPRQVLAVDAAVLAAEGLAPGALRENLTLEGIAVDALPAGARLRLGGAVVLRATGPCEPCRVMDEVRPGLRASLRGRRGTLFVVEQGGLVRSGDPVVAL